MRDGKETGSRERAGRSARAARRGLFRGGTHRLTAAEGTGTGWESPYLVAVYGLAHDGSKDALKDFAKDLKDEPGISAISPMDVPGYAGALDINHGAAMVRAKKQGSMIVLEYQVVDPAGEARVESSIQHAAKEAGFDENS